MKLQKAKVKQRQLIEESLSLYRTFPELVMQQKGWTKEQFKAELDRLEGNRTKSIKGRTARNKGATYERKIAEKFCKRFKLAFARTPLSGGFQKHVESDFKGDIIALNPDVDFRLHIEAKNQKAWRIGAWLEQALSEVKKGAIPIVVFHRHQKVEGGKITVPVEDFVTLRLSDFLEIVDSKKVVTRRR